MKKSSSKMRKFYRNLRKLWKIGGKKETVLITDYTDLAENYKKREGKTRVFTDFGEFRKHEPPIARGQALRGFRDYSDKSDVRLQIIENGYRLSV
jgi:hypothetical protein